MTGPSVRPTGARNYVYKEILHNAVCVHAEVARVGQEFVEMGDAEAGGRVRGQQALLLHPEDDSNGCVQAWSTSSVSRRG